MMPKMNSNQHSHTQKIRILRLLEKNNFNYSLTSKQNGIARPTIKRWEKLYGKEVFGSKSPTEEALAQIDCELKYNDINIIRNLYSIRKRTLQRIVVMAEKETKIEAMVNLLKFVSGEIQRFTEMEKPGNDLNVDYIAIITNQLIENRDKKAQLEE